MISTIHPLLLPSIFAFNSILTSTHYDVTPCHASHMTFALPHTDEISNLPNFPSVFPIKAPININTIRQSTVSLSNFPQPHNWTFISWDGYTKWYRQHQFTITYKLFWPQSSLPRYLQRHVIQISDDGRLERWLIRCKNSIEQVRKSLDLYYTLRTHVPELMTGWDTKGEWFKNASSNE